MKQLKGRWWPSIYLTTSILDNRTAGWAICPCLGRARRTSWEDVGLVLFPNNFLISVVFREIITRLMLFPNHFLISVVFRDTGLGLFPNHFLISAVFRERGIRNTRSR